MHRNGLSRSGLAALAGTLFLFGSGAVSAQQQPQPAPSKPATAATKAANQKVLQTLPFNDKADFEDAQRGLIARPDTLTIRDAKGNPVWDLESYKKYIGLDKPAWVKLFKRTFRFTGGEITGGRGRFRSWAR